MKEERVTTFKIQKETMLKNELEERGFSASLSDVKFTVKQDDSGEAIYKKLLSAIKRKNKDITGSPLKDIENFLQEISFGIRQVKIELLSADNDYEKYLLELLYCCTNLSGRGSYELLKKTPELFIEQYQPVRVHITEDGKTRTGYSLLRKDITPNKHNTSRKVTSSKNDYVLMLDFLTFVCETLAFNSLYKYAKANLEEVQFELAYLYATTHIQQEKIFLIPDDEKFAQELKHYWNKYNLINLTGYEVREGEVRKDFYTTFYMDDKYDISKYKYPYQFINESMFRRVVLPKFTSSMMYIKDKIERRFQEMSEHAKTYQDKKYASERIRLRAKDNLFLGLFGKVELDNEVDLSKFLKVEQEFKCLQTEIFFPKVKDHTFRIRKLGHHKAAGLYFPYFKCLAVDIECPGSFLHEFGHLIDFVFHKDESRLLNSERLEFKPLIREYTRLVTNEVHKLAAGDQFRLKWGGKTKYNVSYYLQNTEIFARTYELYLTKVKGIESSLLQENYTEIVYPCSERFLNMIAGYFDDLFSGYAPEKITSPDVELQLDNLPVIFEPDGDQLSFNLGI
jgi:hypothetical protein